MVANVNALFSLARLNDCCCFFFPFHNYHYYILFYFDHFDCCFSVKQNQMFIPYFVSQNPDRTLCTVLSKQSTGYTVHWSISAYLMHVYRILYYGQWFTVHAFTSAIICVVHTYMDVLCKPFYKTIFRPEIVYWIAKV